MARTQPIELGRSHDGYWYRYDGEMDDFRIYDRILTPAEISAIYTSDALVDAGALKLRYNFDTAGIGWTVTYPFGTLGKHAHAQSAGLAARARGNPAKLSDSPPWIRRNSSARTHNDQDQVEL